MPKGIKQMMDIHSNVMDKQAELQKKSTVYSTERIEKLTKEMADGGKPDVTPFFHGWAEWRDSGVIFEYTEKELQELEKCAMDCTYFVETYCKFLNSKGRTTVKLRDYQRRILNVMSNEYWDPINDVAIPEHKHIALLQARQTSKTTTTSAYIAWYIIFHYDRNVFVCANKGRTATEIMGKIKEVIEGLPYFLKPGIVNLSEARIKFENGCSIKCAAASSTPATGDSIHLLYIDEAALIQPKVIDEYWASVIPTMSAFVNSQVIISSTPRGKSGRFFDIVDKSIKGQNDFYLQRVDWWEVPGHNEKWAEEQRSLLGDELFDREFGLSFDITGSRLITNKTACLMNRIKQTFISHEFYNVPKEISDKIIWHPTFDPETLTYYDLLNRRFLLVIDTAQGIESGAAGKKDSDYNIINIFEIEGLSPNRININRDNGTISTKDVIQYKQVGLYMDNFKNEEHCADAAKYIVFHILKCGFKDIDNTKILVEMNFNGNNWLNKFKSHPNYYESIILKTAHGINQTPGQKPKMMLGFRTTSGSHGKNYYCDLGAAMMHKRQIIVSQFNEDINKSSIGELQQFSKSDKGKYEGVCCHDDISVTCFFVSIASESQQFISWVNEWLETCPQTYKIMKIRQMLDIYVETEFQMSDEVAKVFYRTASAGFGKLTHQQNGYGSIMQGNIPQHNNGTPSHYQSPFQSSFSNQLR